MYTLTCIATITSGLQNLDVSLTWIDNLSGEQLVSNNFSTITNTMSEIDRGLIEYRSVFVMHGGTARDALLICVIDVNYLNVDSGGEVMEEIFVASLNATKTVIVNGKQFNNLCYNYCV